MRLLPAHPIGLIHLVAAVAALICGTIVLVQRKGTAVHKRWGYAYVFSMTVLLGTSFLIYRLFHGFGLFHGFAVLASATLIAGFVPALRRKPPHWIDLHFGFMYWSVIGLYATFVAEVLTRVPKTPFFGMVGVATFVVIAIGLYFWREKRRVWSVQFRSYRTAAAGAPGPRLRC